MKVLEGQKVQLGERRFATVTSDGTLIIEATFEGPLGDDRARCIGLSPTESQALLDLLANGEAVEHRVHRTVETETIEEAITNAREAHDWAEVSRLETIRDMRDLQ